MTPDALKLALAAAQGEAIATCSAVLADPEATVHTDWAEHDPAPTSSLLTIYRRRTDHVAQIGLPTLGFQESVDRLEETPYPSLRLVGMEGSRGHPWCVVFLAPDAPTVVAALAVLGPMPPT